MFKSLSPVRIIKRFRKVINQSVLGFLATVMMVSPVSAATPLIITEFMPNPIVITDANGEWIELYNQDEEQVDLTGWTLDGTSIIALSGGDLIVPGLSVYLICIEGDSIENDGLPCNAELDTSGSKLSNTGELVTLKDNENTVIDSITYTAADETPGSSTIPDRDNETGQVTTDSSDVEVFNNDDINIYNSEEDDEDTGTPGELTLLDVIDITPGLGTLETLLELADSEECRYLYNLQKIADGKATFFAPNDAAFAQLPGAEVAELTANPDELCELLAYHVHLSDEAILVADIPEGTTLLDTLSGDQISTMWNGDDQLVVQNNASVMVDQANVLKTDLIAANGVVHIIRQVLKPMNPAVNIDQLITDSTTPELTGTFDSTAADEFGTVCILVRVDGLAAYPALLNSDGTWSIPAGTVTIDPTDSNTLFSVVMRSPQFRSSCDELTDDLTVRADFFVVKDSTGTTYGNDLLALTMTDDVVVVEEPKEDGEVLADTITKTVKVVAEAPPVVVCGKGLCDSSVVTTATQSSQSEADEDSTQSNNNTSGLSDFDVGSEEDSTSTDWAWWFVGGGTVALLWYVLWRRQEV